MSVMAISGLSAFGRFFSRLARDSDAIEWVGPPEISTHGGICNGDIAIVFLTRG